MAFAPVWPPLFFFFFYLWHLKLLTSLPGQFSSLGFGLAVCSGLSSGLWQDVPFTLFSSALRPPAVSISSSALPLHILTESTHASNDACISTSSCNLSAYTPDPFFPPICPSLSLPWGHTQPFPWTRVPSDSHLPMQPCFPISSLPLEFALLLPISYSSHPHIHPTCKCLPF